jgi:hypothetical protein
MNSFEITGEVVFIGEEVFRNDGKFRKKELVIRVKDGEYTTEPPISFINKKIQLLDGIHVGDNVLVTFSIGGRKFTDEDMWFRNIDGHGIQKL